jgi:hypothetical protein
LVEKIEVYRKFVGRFRKASTNFKAPNIILKEKSIILLCELSK